MHAPGVGAVWDSGRSLLRTEDAALLPTKTSLVNGQRLGSLLFAVNAGFQVALIRFIEAFLRITVVARILSWWNLFWIA